MVNDINIDVQTNLPTLTYYNLFFKVIDYIMSTYDYSKLSSLLEKISIPENITPEALELIKEMVKESYTTSITNQTLVLISLVDSILKSYGKDSGINFEKMASENLTVREAIIILKKVLEEFFKLTKELGILPQEYEEILPSEAFEKFTQVFE